MLKLRLENVSADGLTADLEKLDMLQRVSMRLAVLCVFFVLISVSCGFPNGKGLLKSFSSQDQNLLSAPRIYPEYDEFFKDHQLSFLILINEENMDLKIGLKNYRSLFRTMKYNKNFSTNDDEESFDVNLVRSGRDQEEASIAIRMVFSEDGNVETLHKVVDAGAMQTPDIVMYTGHSETARNNLATLFFDEKHYPQKKHQLFFLYSCYSRKIAAQKILDIKSKIDRDPSFFTVDVISNEKPAVSTASGESYDFLVMNAALDFLFGTASDYKTPKIKDRSFQQLLKLLNDKDIPNPAMKAIFWVDGADKNQFKPQ